MAALDDRAPHATLIVLQTTWIVLPEKTLSGSLLPTRAQFSRSPMNLGLIVVSLFAATEALVLPGASSRLVARPQPKLQVQMVEPDTISSEDKASSEKIFDVEEKTSSSSTLPASYDVELASKLQIEALQGLTRTPTNPDMIRTTDPNIDSDY